jgi:hypothetical protein
MLLTQSLFNALVRLRYPNKDRKLWADGLCINQADNKEKGVQVALMPQIYTHAGKVLVHLGIEADSSELLQELLQKLEKVNYGLSQKPMVSREEFRSYGLPPPDDKVWGALIDVLCRPWFLRVWIIQEVILARDIRIFCGDWELRWGLLANISQKFDLFISSNPHYHHIRWTHEFQQAQHAALSLGLVLAFRLTRSAVAERLDLRRDIESIPSTGGGRAMSKTSRKIWPSNENSLYNPVKSTARYIQCWNDYFWLLMESSHLQRRFCSCSGSSFTTMQRNRKIDFMH